MEPTVRPSHTLTAIASASLLSLSTASLAGDEAASEVITITANKVSRDKSYGGTNARSATRSDAAQLDIPQTVTALPRQVLDDQAARSLQDALRNVPGVGLSTGDGQRDQVSIRGFTAIGDQFIDGFRDDALYFRDLSNIEEVEIIKGPASVLYGRGSSGGMINRVSKKPGIDRSEIALSVGSWADKRGEFDLARKGEKLSWRLTGALEDADSYRDQQFLKRQAIAPSLLAQIDADTQLLLQADYLKDRRLTDFGVPSFQGRPVDVDPSRYYGAANAADADFSESEVASASATLSHRISSSLSLRNALRSYHYTLDRANTTTGSVDEKAKTVSFNRGAVSRAEYGFFNQTELTQKIAFATTQHELLYGIELGRQSKDTVTYSQSKVATTDLFNPVLPVLPRAVSVSPSADNRALLTTTAFYLQDQMSLASHWKALLGLRYDRFEQQTDDRRVGQSDLARTDHTVSPRAGLVWQPTAQQSWYVAWSRSFQPSAESFALAANNADLAPEETTNSEIGAKYELFGGAALLSASLFRLERTNIKTVDPANSAKLIPVGVQRTNGLELSAQGDLKGGWQILAGYAYMDAKVVESTATDAGQAVQGKRATLTPRHSGNIWLTRALSERLSLGGGVNYVGDRFANTGNTVTLPGYTTADLMARYALGAWQLQFNLNNLFDKRYIVAGHGSNANLNLPGAPRNASLTARLRF